MIRFKLSKNTEQLKPYLRELLLYSGISNITVEIGHEQTDPSTVFVDESQCRNLEDVLSEFALKIYNHRVHGKCLPSSVLALEYKHGRKASAIASVIEKAIEPSYFFSLERFNI